MTTALNLLPFWMAWVVLLGVLGHWAVASSFFPGVRKNDMKLLLRTHLLGKFSNQTSENFLFDIYLIFSGRKMSDMLAVAMLVTYPINGDVSTGKVHLDVTRVSNFGAYLSDAIVRFFTSKHTKVESSEFEDVSDGEELFALIVHLSVCLRPLVHPGYHRTLRK